MAMMDYGAIAFKNGKLISTNMFTPMIDTVGWEDTENDTYHDYALNKDCPLYLNGNFFVYIGDKDFTIAFYKCHMVIVKRFNDGTFDCDVEYFNDTNYSWYKWTRYEMDSKITVTKRNGYYVCKWKYKNDKYKVYFGYGVDLSYYKDWHMVNYYRSPIHTIRRIKYWIKEKIYDWKYLR